MMADILHWPDTWYKSVLQNWDTSHYLLYLHFVFTSNKTLNVVFLIWFHLSYLGATHIFYLSMETHQDDTKRLAETNVDLCVASRHLCLVQKIANKGKLKTLDCGYKLQTNQQMFQRFHTCSCCWLLPCLCWQPVLFIYRCERHL